jgi:hypothetical protein
MTPEDGAAMKSLGCSKPPAVVNTTRFSQH